MITLVIAIAVHSQTTSKVKEQQLLAELNTARYISRAKDHHISMLEEELQAKQEKMISLEQKQRMLEMLQQKSEAEVHTCMGA